MFEYIGAIHVHSLFSDGSGSVPEIAKFADEVGLDYVLLTDHNTLRALKEGFEGWYGNSLLLVGCEINDRYNKNHYLAFGIDKTYSTRSVPKTYVKKIKEDGGIGFIAHPHEKRSSMKEHPPYPWLEWDMEYFDGIEIWNHMSEWMEGLTDQNKYNRFIHPLKSIVAPPEETLIKWDELNLKRKVVGIAGVDAHAHRTNFLGFFEVEVFPYKVLFKSLRTHILSPEKIEKGEGAKSINRAKEIIYSGLQSGNCFFSNYYHGDARGFRFFAEDGVKIYQMGDTVDLINQIKLRVFLPNISGEIRLIHNSKVAGKVENIDAEFIIKRKGVYRVEVFLDNNAWIFSNHIRIGI